MRASRNRPERRAAALRVARSAVATGNGVVNMGKPTSTRL